MLKKGVMRPKKLSPRAKYLGAQKVRVVFRLSDLDLPDILVTTFGRFVGPYPLARILRRQ